MIYKYLFCFFIFFNFFSVNLQSQINDKIEQTTLSDIDSKSYGQGAAFGFSIFGDGLSFIARRSLKSEDQIGLSTSFGLDFELNDDRDSILRVVPGIAFRFEYNFHLGNTYKEKMKKGRFKKKFRKHYISIKPGASFALDNTYGIALTWRRETFLLENKNHVRGLDLGIFYNVNDSETNNLTGSRAGIYFRLDWTWFRNNKNK